MSLRLAVVCSFLLILPALTRAAQTAAELFEQSQRWLESGEFVLARDGFARCWKDFEAAHGSESPLTIEARIFYGQLLTMTGRPDQGLNVLAPLVKQPGRLGLIASGSFALALRQSGQPDRAVKLLRETIARFKPETREDYVHMGRFHSELAVSYAYLKRYRESTEHSLHALKLLDEAGGPPRPHRACLLTILGQVQLLSGRDAEAAATLRKAEEAGAPFWNNWHPEMAILQGALGVVAMRRGDYAEAERRTRSSLAAMEKLLGPDHGEVGMITQQLAAILKKQKRKDEARVLEAQARRILSRDPADATPSVSIWSFQEAR